MHLVGAGSRRSGEPLGPIRAAIILIAANVVAAVFAAKATQHAPGAPAVFDTAIAFCATITGYALLGRHRRQREGAALPAAAAYIMLAVFALGHLVSFPGAVVANASLVPATTQTAEWCLMAGFTCFGVLIGLYALSTMRVQTAVPHTRARTSVLLALVGASLVAAAFIVLTVEAPWLFPTLVDRDMLLPALTSGVEPTAGFFLLTGLWLLLRCRKTALNYWLAVATLAMLVAVALDLLGGARYTVGWYVSKADIVFASIVVLTYFVSDVTVRLARSDVTLSTQADLLYAGLDVETVMARVTERVLKTTPAESATVCTLEGANAVVRSTAGGLRGAAAVVEIGTQVPLNESLVGLSVRTNKPLMTADALADPRTNARITSSLGIRAMMIAPLAFGAEVIGVVIAASSRADVFSQADLDSLAWMADAIAAAMVNASRFGQVKIESRIDALTGLGNRRAYEERLDHEAAEYARSSLPLSLAIIDLDQFKEVNDRCGHAAGDRLLRDVAEAMRAVVRGRDECFRIGGDEFAVVMPNTMAADAVSCIDRLTAAIGSCESPLGNATASIGFADADESDPVALHQRADRAMYEAKRRAHATVTR